MKCWKIKNDTNNKDKKTKPQDIKIAVSTGTAKRGVGLILKPDQFCISEAVWTSPLDSQYKKGFITIEEFDNNLEFPMGEPINVSELDKAIKEAQDFSSEAKDNNTN